MNGFNYGYRHIPSDPMQMMYQQRLQSMQQQIQPQAYGTASDRQHPSDGKHRKFGSTACDSGIHRIEPV